MARSMNIFALMMVFSRSIFSALIQMTEGGIAVDEFGLPKVPAQN